MNSLADPGAVDALIARLGKLHDKRPRAWGKMTAHEMLCHLNDSFEVVTRRTPSQLYCENLVDQFDEMLEESAERPLVMSVVLHSFILGVPHRLRRFRQVIEHIVKQRDKVWLTRPGEICRYVESLPAGVVPGSQ